VLLFSPYCLLMRSAKITLVRIFFPNQIVSAFRILKSGQNWYEIFVSLFDVKGLYCPLYNPRISYNAIARVVWTINNDHHTTNTPTKLKKFEENERKEMKWRMKEFVDFNFQWMDSDYIIRTIFTHFGLYNPKYANHPVESQQMGWKMMFPVSGLHNPECVKTIWIL